MIMMAEMKNVPNKPYKEAFDFAMDTGYNDIEDIDSGVKCGSWPPLGKMYAKEGNYEFLLPHKEMEECLARVKQFSSTKLLSHFLADFHSASDW